MLTNSIPAGKHRDHGIPDPSSGVPPYCSLELKCKNSGMAAILTILATTYLTGFALMIYWTRHARHAEEHPLDEGRD
jgi:hypothetical protein